VKLEIFINIKIFIQLEILKNILLENLKKIISIYRV